MDESFDLPVEYKGKELSFPARLLITGYTYKFHVQVNDMEVFFEPDEERVYRAILPPSYLERSKRIDTELIKAIAEAIESIGR